MNGNRTKMRRLTKTYDLYEVVKIPFPFTDTATTKVRPALILSSARHFNAKIGSSIMAMITSVKPNQDLWSSDVVIEDLQPTGLPVSSLIRFKMFTLDHRLILDHLGNLSTTDRQRIQRKLKEILVL